MADKDRSSWSSPRASSAPGAALAALQLWQTFEYLSPQAPPKPELDVGTCVWAISPVSHGDEAMPWVDKTKIASLDKLFRDKHRYVLFGGVVSGTELVETVRELIGAPAIDLSEQSPPKDAASFVIPIDDQGYVSGDVFVSTVPWAISRIMCTPADGLFDFSGFFGEGGVQQQVKEAVHALLLERLLILDDSVDGAPVPEEVVDQDVEPSETDADRRRGLRTLDAADVHAVAEKVFEACGWRPSKETDWVIQTQRAATKKRPKAPEDPLNSFFAEDLEQVQRAYLAGNYGKTFAQYMETPIHPQRCDLESTRQFLIDGVHPSLTPRACWPGAHPLVTAQQFAVNMIMKDLAGGGLFSVNGPPGTGKTTLLKDILASIVLQRADALASFKVPKHAFQGKITVEDHRYPVWKLDDKLRGFGVVVACAQNGAAENISKELPGLAAIDQMLELDYFSEVADSIGLPKKAKRSVRKRWGLISAALGNQENRTAFVADFWEGRIPDDDDEKNAKASKQGGGKAQPSAPPDPLRPLTLQDWVAEFGDRVPTWSEAKRSYALAKKRAEAALHRTGTLATQIRENAMLAPQLEPLRDRLALLCERLAGLRSSEEEAKTSARAACDRMERAKAVAAALRTLEQRRTVLKITEDGLAAVLQRKPDTPLPELDQVIARIEQERKRDKVELDAHDLRRPGGLRAFFSPASMHHWTARNDLLIAELNATRQQLNQLQKRRELMIQWQRDLANAQHALQPLAALAQTALTAVHALGMDDAWPPGEAAAQAVAAENVYERCCASLRDLAMQVSSAVQAVQTLTAEIDSHTNHVAKNAKAIAAAGILGEHRDAWQLYQASRENFHRASPYHDEPDVFQARRELFAAAMNLHQAFIVHAWDQLKTILFVATAMLQGRIKPNQIHGGPMPLWDAILLVVPLISTTFASFPRLFRGVGQEQLAWVLIDEAGQAAPQACAGALWRAKRAVIVGDPLQLEPVIGLPKELVEPLRARCGTDLRYVPPAASAQTMADLSNRYGMYLNEGDPDQRIWLGSPLVVHRRCVNPMFDIANAIAYENRFMAVARISSILTSRQAVG
jgi:hypothetical protein